ncbi:MAG: glucose-6-phosphate dehydrogenase [bacterium]|jgi:glucose-6-phosphate 1-dehydrogenase
MSEPQRLGIVVVGASGDLAQTKVIPALFALYCQHFLPDDFHVYGLARTEMDHAAFRKKVAENLTCRYVPGEACADRTEEFLQRCYYCQGQYSSTDSFLDLFQLMREVEGVGPINRIFYMAIPPSVFQDVARALGNSGLVACDDSEGWSRIVVEKPFGRDRDSSDRLVKEMQTVFTEEMTYRIDHYLGKEIVQNLMVLRFANLIFEPLWNKAYIESVSIKWAEPIGVGQRGGYFDGFGIIRDVMQNHLLQILALLAMECPREYSASAVRNAKVALLRDISPITLDRLVVGQYGTSTTGQQRAYVAAPNVPPDSLTPTYAAAVLQIHNPRWEGVPFLIEAGKALDQKINEVRIRFRKIPAGLFGKTGAVLHSNELIMRIQPDESIVLRIMNKLPGLGLDLAPTELNLRYQAAFSALIPEAYECLLLDVVKGDRSLFIRADELEAAWDVFTPVLQQLESQHMAPDIYPYGSSGPKAGWALAQRWGV